MILSDISIQQRLVRGDLSLVPAPDLEVQLQPASLDVRLGNEFVFFPPLPEDAGCAFCNHTGQVLYFYERGPNDPPGNQRIPCPECPKLKGVIDTRDPSTLDNNTILTTDDPVTIGPGEFALGTTLERITMPHDLVARVEGRSSIGRLGLTVHVTAGFIDPGFEGQITLEIANLNWYPIVIYPGMRIAQLAFHNMTTAAARPYGHAMGNSKYQGQSSVTASKIAEEKE